MSNLKSRESFDMINQWYRDATEYCREKTVYALVGTKCDLSDKREVTHEEGV